MFCPYCANEKTRVMSTVTGMQNVRFRMCKKCKKAWVTVESVKPGDGI